MKPEQLFLEVVRSSQDLPTDVRAHADEARGIRESSFDETYIEFLDEQIRLSPRGLDWTAILRRRRDALRSFCHLPHVDGHIRTGRFDTWVKIDPKTRAVIYWEQLEDDPVA
jgi:hypothetical protein